MAVSERILIRRVYNNNVVLGTDPDGTEVVLLGKGLGFQRKPGEFIDPHGSQRFVADGAFKATQVANVLSDATLEETDLARRIASLARDELGVKDTQAVILPILDHLTYAVRRAAQGVTIDFPLRWEVAQLFPAESALGRRAMELVNSKLGIRLQDDEWVAFALHFINQSWAGGDLSKTVSMTSTIGHCFLLLQHQWGTPIDQNSMSAARFVTHIRYLFVRAFEDRQLNDLHIDVMASVRKTYPAAADAAIALARLIAEAVERNLTNDEVSYLALHTSRLYAEIHGDPSLGSSQSRV